MICICYFFFPFANCPNYYLFIFIFFLLTTVEYIIFYSLFFSSLYTSSSPSQGWLNFRQDLWIFCCEYFMSIEILQWMGFWIFWVWVVNLRLWALESEVKLKLICGFVGLFLCPEFVEGAVNLKRFFFFLRRNGA